METTLDVSLMHLTDEQFYQLCQANRDLRLELSATGELSYPIWRRCFNWL